MFDSVFGVCVCDNISFSKKRKIVFQVVKGKRNLQISVVGDTSVELKWSKISIDTTCNGTKELYKVQWKRMGHSSVNINITNAFSQIITGEY